MVAEQVRSLGAKFVDIDLGEMSQTEDGYAKQLTDEQLAMQREGMKKVIARSDIVITTAQVFGRAAPRIVTKDMVEAMKPGSIIVDMAVESGGNVEGSVVDQTAEVNQVRILGYSNLPARVSKNASQMYSTNLLNLVSEFWDKETSAMILDQEDEIIQSCLITHGKEVVNETIKNLVNGGKE